MTIGWFITLAALAAWVAAVVLTLALCRAAGQADEDEEGPGC